jgi:hypothetical protein
MPAIQDPTAVPQQAQAVPGQPQQAGVPVQGVAADQAGAGTPVGDVSAAFDPNDPYPGDANKELLAQWMARTAYRAGLPPELPVMAGLVESGLRNLNYGDADSVGFFQMRVGIWNQGEYAGYPDDPQLQMKWFLDQAVALKEKRIAQGFTDFGSDPAAYGEWIADVERPAEQYRGRYQLRLDEARQLIWSPSATAATL